MDCKRLRLFVARQIAYLAAMSQIHRIAFFCLGLLYLSACRQDADRIPPQVLITQPTGTIPSYSFGETLGLTFTASDDSRMISFAIRLTDEQGNIRFSSDYLPLEEGPGSASRSYSIPLDNRYWPSGDYSLGVFVVDEADNEGAAFKTVRFFEAPLKRERTLVIREEAGTVFVDSLFQNALIGAGSLAMDFGSSIGSSRHQQVVIGGSEAGLLQWLNLPGMEVEAAWSQQNPLSGDFVRSFAFAADGLTYYAACFDGFIREFKFNGQLLSTLAVPEGFRPELLLVDGNKVLSTLRSIGGNNYLLASFFRNSGSLAASTPLPIEVKAMLPFEGDVLFLGNDNDNLPRIYRANSSDLGYNEMPWLLSTAPLRDAVLLSSGYTAVAHEDGIWLHRFGQGFFFSGTANGVNARQLAYDPVSNRIYAAGMNELHQVSGSNGNLLVSTPASGIRAVHLILNK